MIASRTYLSSLERGQKSPTLRKISALSRAIGIHPLSLLTRTWLEYENRSNIDTLLTCIQSEAYGDLPMTTPPAIRLLVSDDHPMMREGIKRLYSLTQDIRVDAEAADGTQTLERLEAGNFDLLLLDMSMPGLSGKELIRAIRLRYPALPILVLSMHQEPSIVQGALEAGANGYLTKDQDPELLLHATRTTALGAHFVDPKFAGVVSIGNMPLP